MPASRAGSGTVGGQDAAQLATRADAELAKTLPRWYWTVRALMNSRAPISGFSDAGPAARAASATSRTSTRCPHAHRLVETAPCGHRPPQTFTNVAPGGNMSTPTGGNAFLHALELNVRTELTLAETSQLGRGGRRRTDRRVAVRSGGCPALRS